MTETVSSKKKWKFTLGWQILAALILGIAFGMYLHDYSGKDWYIVNVLKPAGEIFIRLIKMIVVPIVLSTLIVGIAGVGDAKKLGGIGVKTLLYFEIVTTIAIVVGVFMANVFHPGSGVNINDLAKTDISTIEATAKSMDGAHGIVTTILSLVPSNIFDALSKGNMLPIIFFSVLFGLGLAALSEDKKDPLIGILQTVSETMFKVTNIIMRYAPIGVFALISVTVADFGVKSLYPLINLIIVMYAAVIFFSVVVLGIIAYIFKFNIFKLMKILKDELILAYTTSSSESVLPRIMDKMEHYGAPRSVTSFVIPVGYSFNLDGSTLYQSIAAIFIAQLFGIDLSLKDQILVVITLMITSKGIAGVPGASLVVLLATLGTVGIPLEGVAYITGIDRILDMARTALNVIGNALAALVISRWEGNYDDKKGKAYAATYGV